MKAHVFFLLVLFATFFKLDVPLLISLFPTIQAIYLLHLLTVSQQNLLLSCGQVFVFIYCSTDLQHFSCVDCMVSMI